MRHGIKYISVCTLITILLMFISVKNNVYASLLDNTPTYYDEGYHRRMSFSTSGIATGEIHYSITADLTNYDTMIAPYSLPIQKCCDKLVPPAENGFWVTINGQQIFADTNQNITTDIYWPPVNNPEIDIKKYRFGSANISYDATARMKQCSYCGTKTPTQVFYYGVNFYDYRGVATMKNERLTVANGQSVTLTPSYNEYTDHVQWGIRYPGESGFTLLSEGTNRGGIVASGVKNRSITLTSIPFSSDGIDVGVFVYDENGSLPAGTSFPNTPFFTKLVSIDNEGPVIDIIKTPDKVNKAINVTVNASDKGGLPSEAYSWDGGKSFVAENNKAFYIPGTYEVLVKDVASNISRKSFYIDSSDIESVNPSRAEDSPASEAEEESEKGGNGNTQGGKEQSSGTEGSDKTKPDTSKTERPDNITSQLKNEESVVVKPLPVIVPNGDNTEKNKLDSTSSSEDAEKKKADNSNGKNKPSKLSDSTTKSLFDKIRENSQEYMISMHDTSGNEELAINADVEPEIDMSSIDEEYEAAQYENSNVEEEDYRPKYLKKTKWFWALIILITILLILILLFVLFFGVIIYTDKDTELSEIYDGFGTKVPVAITFITYENGYFSVCFRELLDKYGMVYARFGVIFSLVFEGEKISITTKFKGDKKREIAKENIKKEIIVGIKGGKGK